MEEDDVRFPPFLWGHGELVEVVRGVVAKDVDWLAEGVGGRSKDSEVAHGVREGGFALAWPLGMLCGVVELLRRSARQALGLKPCEESRARVGQEVFGHVVGFGGGVDGKRLQPRGVEGLTPRTATLGGSAPPVGFEFAWGGALAIE
eukprot:5585990-Pleurochrysis_carterae.AAC.2